MRKCFRYVLVSAVAASVLFSCTPAIEEEDTFYSTTVSISDVVSGDRFCFADDQVSCSFRLGNFTDYKVAVQEVKVILKSLTEGGRIIAEKVVCGDALLESGDVIDIARTDIFKVPAGMETFCRLSALVTFKGGSTSETFLSYLRLIDRGSLLTYNVTESEYEGLPVYRLKGDMSAGFGVLKALTSMNCGISPTYDMIPSGSGPHPVVPTEEFLQRSVRYTVDLYNSAAGPYGKIKRVVIGTGIASLSYFATTMGAAYLPIHYLVSANAVSEINDILDFSNGNGYPSYAVLGYDGSMPDVSVAWIKLLDLPQEYRKFIVDHQVEEVYIYGLGQAGLGESYARKVLYEDSPSEDYAPGQLYILYTNHGSDGDIAALKARLYDYGSARLGTAQYISDWESGIVNDQIENISESVHGIPGVKVYTVASDDMMDLYNLSSHLVLQYISGNQEHLDSPYVNGVVLNEYLSNHPQYEVFKGYVPLLYWQGNPASSTVSRIDSDIRPAVALYYPEAAENIYKGCFYLNSYSGRAALKAELLRNGADASRISTRKASDQWNPSDDSETDAFTSDRKTGSAEEFAYDIIDNIGVDRYRSAVRSMESLTVDELRTVCSRFEGMYLIEN